MKTYVKSKLLIVLSLVSFNFVACDDDEVQNPPDANSGEVITRLELEWISLSGSDTVRASFSDPDGPGGIVASTDSVILDDNDDWNLRISVYDDTKNPVDTVSNEISEEADVHQFIFSSDTSILKVLSSDFDSNFLPLGLMAFGQTPGSGFTELRIELRHFDSAADKLAGLNFDRDIDVVFPCRVD